MFPTEQKVLISSIAFILNMKLFVSVFASAFPSISLCLFVCLSLVDIELFRGKSQYLKVRRQP